MAEDNVRRIDSARTAKRREHTEQAREAEAARLLEERAHEIADGLRASGAVVIACADESAREKARKAGRRAGRIINRKIRTQVLPDGRVGVWDTERMDHPLHSQLDRTRGNKTISNSGVFDGFRPPGIPGPDGPEGEGSR